MRSAMAFCSLFVLATCARAQSLVGLPELGVTLSGSPSNPIIENHASQAIIGHVLRVFYANSAIPANAANFKARDIWLNRGSGVQPNQVEQPLAGVFAHGKLWVNGIFLANPTRIVLDSVVFADGQVAGPDVIGNFARLSERVKTMKELAALVHNSKQNPQLESAAWAEVERICTQKGSAWPLALDLARAHASVNSSSPYDIANRVAAIPTPWRAK